jgi:Na+-driven multidrug efflux pump
VNTGSSAPQAAPIPSPDGVAMTAVAGPSVASVAPPRVLLQQVLALAAPTTLLAVLQVAAQLLETWLAARQGTAALAGWAVLLPFALLLQQMSGGAMGGGVVSAVARALGAGRRDEASALVLHALIIAVSIGLVFAIGLTVFARPLLTAVAGPEAADAAGVYAWWVFGLGAVPVWVSNTLASVLRGGGRHALAARTLLLSALAYPVLAWLLAETAQFGMAGLGAALALVQCGSATLMAVVVARGGAGFVPSLRVTPSVHLFKRILAVGAVASTLTMVSNLTTILVTAQLRTYGVAAVAAYGIAARLEFLVVPLAFGVGSALTALVGRAVGGGDWATARRTAWVGGLLSLAVTGCIGAVVAMWPLQFALFFTSDLQVATIAARGLQFTGWAFGGFGVGLSMYFACMGAGRMKWSVVAALTRISLAVGGGWWLAHGLGLGLEGHFIGVALAAAAYGLITASSVRAGVWPGTR